MSEFPPKPGTAAYRVLAHLETILPRRPRATAGMIAGELRGLTPSQVRDALEAAHAAGYVNREAEFGAFGRGPVFYELVRRTSGELALGGGSSDRDGVTGSGDAAHEPRGVIEPVVDPHPEAAPILERHPGAFTSQPLSKVVAIRPTSDGADVEIERTPELADWLAATRGGADLEREVAVSVAADRVRTAAEPAPAPAVTVALDFAAPGCDQFAVALASDGRLHCWRGVVPYVFSKAEARALVDYLNRIDLEPILEGEA